MIGLQEAAFTIADAEMEQGQTAHCGHCQRGPARERNDSEGSKLTVHGGLSRVRFGEVFKNLATVCMANETAVQHNFLLQT